MIQEKFGNEVVSYISGIKTWRAFISRPPAPYAVCQQCSYLLTYCRRKHAKAKYSSVISVYI